jgi:hypothetical protein
MQNQTLSKQYLKKGSIVSWLSCGARWYGKVKFTANQWVYVVPDAHKDTSYCFNIDSENLTLEKP